MHTPPERHIAQINAFLLDMDGTIYLGDRLIEGAADFVAYLRAQQHPFLFLTNNPTKDAAAYVAKLAHLGIPASERDVLTAGEATVRYLETQTPYRRLYTLGPPAFVAELDRAGFESFSTSPEAVVLSFDTGLTYAKLERATRLLLDGLPYYGTNPDFVCPTEHGPIPDTGSIAALLEAATGRTPSYIGKPEASMIAMAMDRLEADPAQTAMVGDRLYTDMAMAHRAGIAGVLVMSGETTQADLAGARPQPHFAFESVAALQTALEAAAAGPAPHSA